MPARRTKVRTTPANRRTRRAQSDQHVPLSMSVEVICGLANVLTAATSSAEQKRSACSTLKGLAFDDANFPAIREANAIAALILALHGGAASPTAQSAIDALWSLSNDEANHASLMAAIEPLEERLLLLFEGLGTLLDVGQSCLQCVGFGRGLLGRHVLLVDPLRIAVQPDLRTHLVGLLAQPVQLKLHFTTAGVDFQQAVDITVDVLGLGSVPDSLSVLPNELDVQHGF